MTSDASSTRDQGRAVLVTGGSRGIGAAIARAFAQQGDRVAVHYGRSAEKAEAVRASLAGEGHVVVQADLARPDEVRIAVDSAAERIGRLDVLVNNAGIGAQGTIEENDDAEWRRVFEVNVFGIVRSTRAALPYLRRSSHAAVVNTCSIAATVGLPSRTLYSATKGAVQSLTLAMAADHVREGIRVTCVNPGTVDTPWIGRLLAAADDPAAERAALEARQPTGRLVTADEVAATIAYLASPTSSATTGTALAVDGGMDGLRLRPHPSTADG
jgi:2-keto-3-deoxy-L-fuconate dehydrogenase